MHNHTKLAYRLLGTAVAITLWELAVRFHFVSDVLLPGPNKVFYTLASMMLSMSFWTDVWSTLWSWVAGVAIGSITGAMVGLVLGLNEKSWFAAEPIIEFVRALPSIILVPLVSVFLGVGASSRVVAAAVVVFALVASSSVTAMRSTRSTYLRLAVAWQMTSAQRLLKFYIPATVTHLAIAIKAAIPLGLIVVVAADMLIATDSGLGRLVMDSLAGFDMARLYAGVLVIGALGYAAVLGSSWIERRTIHWSAA